jgi:hypothetical protein
MCSYTKTAGFGTVVSTRQTGTADDVSRIIRLIYRGNFFPTTLQALHREMRGKQKRGSIAVRGASRRGFAAHVRVADPVQAGPQALRSSLREKQLRAPRAAPSSLSRRARGSGGGVVVFWQERRGGCALRTTAHSDWRRAGSCRVRIGPGTTNIGTFPSVYLGVRFFHQICLNCSFFFHR